MTESHRYSGSSYGLKKIAAGGFTFAPQNLGRPFGDNHYKVSDYISVDQQSLEFLDGLWIF